MGCISHKLLPDVARRRVAWKKPGKWEALKTSRKEIEMLHQPKYLFGALAVGIFTTAFATQGAAMDLGGASFSSGLALVPFPVSAKFFSSNPPNKPRMPIEPFSQDNTVLEGLSNSGSLFEAALSFENSSAPNSDTKRVAAVADNIFEWLPNLRKGKPVLRSNHMTNHMIL